MEAAFQSFAGFGSGGGAASEMDGAHWTKLLKDAKIVGKGFTTTDADLIFARAKAKGARKIGFAEFERALALVAEKKKLPLPELQQRVRGAAPSSSGTQADSDGILSRMTDTKLYTGAHKERFTSDGKGKGLDGRDSVAKGPGARPGHAGQIAGSGNLADLRDRSPADKRGVKVGTAAASGSGGSSSPRASRAAAGGASPSKASPKASPKAAPKAASPSKPASSLRAVFDRYAAFGRSGGAGELDSAKFAKLCKETKLIGKKLSTTDVDIIFTKACPKGIKRLSFSGFQDALGMVAATMGVSVVEVEKKVQAHGGPESSGTKAAGNNIVDRLTDTSQYTGAHKARFDSSGHGRGLAGRDSGGRDGSKVTDLSQLADRSAADVRGRKM